MHIRIKKGALVVNLNKLKKMKDPDIQSWLREVGEKGTPALAAAMLEVDDEARNCIYRNMSQRAAGAVKKDVEQFRAMGPKALMEISHNNKLPELKYPRTL
jgi:flagellar motor switch protein FliG